MTHYQSPIIYAKFRGVWTTIAYWMRHNWSSHRETYSLICVSWTIPPWTTETVGSVVQCSYCQLHSLMLGSRLRTYPGQMIHRRRMTWFSLRECVVEWDWAVEVCCLIRRDKRILELNRWSSSGGSSSFFNEKCLHQKLDLFGSVQLPLIVRTGSFYMCVCVRNSQPPI